MWPILILSKVLYLTLLSLCGLILLWTCQVTYTSHRHPKIFPTLTSNQIRILVHSTSLYLLSL